MNEIDSTINPLKSDLGQGISLRYFERGTRGTARVLTSLDVMREALGVLKLHAQTYIYALALEADARFAISQGPQKTFYGNEVVRWQKVIFSSSQEQWGPFLEEINKEINKLRASPNLTQEDHELERALSGVYTRISVAK